MKSSLALAALIPFALAAGLAGCMTTSAVADETLVYVDATNAYVAFAATSNAAEIGATAPQIAGIEARKVDAWKILVAERDAYAIEGGVTQPALDAKADALKPAGQ
jgi:hypothetical protein